MSADTMHYETAGSRSTIHRKHVAGYDSMLACIFSGPALRAGYSCEGLLDSVIHFKDNCESGEYSRLNLPVTMGVFLLDRKTLLNAKDTRWRELRAVPSFSGVGFFPRLELELRVVGADEEKTTIVVSADTTIENVRTRMKNGEEVLIITDRFRVGGTLVFSAAGVVPLTGEIRITETMELLRPKISHAVINKACECTLRLRVH